MTVYFVQGVDGGLIKIGKAINFHSRLRELEKIYNKKLIALGTIEGSTKEEKELHVRFADLRQEGEWFTPDQSLLDFIELNARTSPVRKRPASWYIFREDQLCCGFKEDGEQCRAKRMRGKLYCHHHVPR